MDHTKWLQLLKITRLGTQLRNIPEDLIPTLIYYCVPISLSQILVFKTLLNDVNECNQAHLKSGIIQHLKCSICKYKLPVIKLDDKLFCNSCAKNNHFEYNSNSKKYVLSDFIEYAIAHMHDEGYNNMLIKEICQKYDEHGFRKKILSDDDSKIYYEYPRTLTYEEQNCLLCLCNENINKCVMCETAKNLRKLYHWKIHAYKPKLIILRICVNCIPKTEGYLTFDKKITHIALTK